MVIIGYHQIERWNATDEVLVLAHFQKLYVGMDHTKAVINEGFYNFAQARRKMKEAVKSPVKSSLHSAETDIFQRLSPVIPKV